MAFQVLSSSSVKTLFCSDKLSHSFMSIRVFSTEFSPNFGNKGIMMKVRIADNSNLVTLVDKIYPRRNLACLK